MMRLPVPFFPRRKNVVGVSRRWIGQRPFKRVGVFSPIRVFLNLPAIANGVENDPDEKHERGECQKSAVGRDFVP